MRGTAPAGTVTLALDGEQVPISADGALVIAFDRDAGPTAVLSAQLADGHVVHRYLNIMPRSWRLQHVNVARRPRGANADYVRVRQAELARIAAARAADRPSGGWRQAFVRPATGRISGRFGSQRIYRGEPGGYHSGLDIAAGAGAPVIAPADGVVVLTSPPAFSLEGNLVIIDHGMGLNSAFVHLAESNVRLGQEVKQGQLIGRVGATGRATGPHLHWSMMWRDARIDPETVLAASAVTE